MRIEALLIAVMFTEITSGCDSLPTGSTSEELLDDDDDPSLDEELVGLLPSSNLLVNGDFNSGTSSWNLVGPVGITNGDGIATPPAAITYPSGTNSTLALWQDLGVQPAGSYTLSGWVRTSGSNQQGWIRADNGYPTQPGGVYCDAKPSGSGSNTYWTQYNCFFNLAASATVHVALVALNGSNTAGGWVAWDSIKLYRDRNSLKLPWPASAGRKCITGYAYNEGDHTGTDAYAIDFGLYYESVVAVKGGSVAGVDTVGNSGGYGKYVLLQHTYKGSTAYSLYAHLDGVAVSLGATVAKGRVIGTSGSSGSATGPHLHFRMRDANYNPIKSEPMSGLVNFSYDDYSTNGACYSSNN